MLTRLCLILLLLLTPACMFNIRGAGNDPRDKRVRGEKEFHPTDLAYLKSTTAIFAIPDADIEEKEAFQKQLSKAWTLTPLQVVSRTELDELTSADDGSRSYFITSYEGLIVTGPSTIGSEVNHYIGLYTRQQEQDVTVGRTDGVKRKLKNKFSSYARIELVPNRRAALAARNETSASNSQLFYNWNLPMLSLYLRATQHDLERGVRPWYFADETNESAIAALEKQTLYVPKRLILQQNPYSGENPEPLKESELFAEYPYPHQVVSTDELTKIMLEASEPIYVFDFVPTDKSKFVSIYSSTEGEIFRRYSPFGGDLEDEDFSDIAELIQEAKESPR